jgi:hypothetical protein
MSLIGRTTAGGDPVAAAPQAAIDDVAMLAERMDRLPATASIWKLVVLLSLGGFFEFYELFSTAYVVPGIVRSGILKETTASFFWPERHRELHRSHLRRPVRRHFRVWLYRRQMRTTRDLHLFAAVVFRLRGGVCDPDRCRWIEFLADDDRDRSRC